ncbi:kinase-like domain-containing protein [Rhizophagus irregularis DAOM 181602=DAOM 197198]|nr:kinase-like domain-containing protein [Rhizophagus irregularis DAOM 181602=DAOM 197198]
MHSNNYEVLKAIEWITYDRFYNIEFISKDGFNKVYRANWIDGNIRYWDNENQNWKRGDHNMIVRLKSLNVSEHLTLVFTNKIKIIHEFYGITKDTETNDYLMVLNSETKDFMIILSDSCEICNYMCNVQHFQRNFEYWTSCNNDIDKFIQDTQLLAHTASKLSSALEWIPYDGFNNIEYIAKGGFAKVYKAKWIDGPIEKWDNENQDWKRYNKDMLVALKSLNNSKNISLEFMNEAILHHKINSNYKAIKFYGMTQDPESKNYIMVLDYAEYGSLRNYLDINHKNLVWIDRISNLYDIAFELSYIHEEELIHRDLHIVPQLLVHLIKRCLDANPLKRPTAAEIKGILDKWKFELFYGKAEIQNQVKEADKINNDLPNESQQIGISQQIDISQQTDISQLIDISKIDISQIDR